MESTKNSLTVRYSSTTSLKPHPDNPRVHSKKQIDQIAKSIQAFGFKVPVLIDSQNRIIAGHGRVLACEQLGIEQAPTIKLTDLSDEKIRALMIADNKLTENASWDEKLLGKNFQILTELNLDFDLDVSGFEYGKIETLMMSIEGVVEGPSEEANDETLAQSEKEISKLGDLWSLGEHRIYCGDALDANSYKQSLGRRKASLVFTDPPYNLSARDIGKVAEQRHGNFHQAAGEMTKDEFESFLSTLFTRLTEFSKQGSIHYICMDWRHLSEILRSGDKHYNELKNVCVWAKDRAGMGSFYRSQHEMVLVYKHGKQKHQNNFQLGEHGRYRTNVWSYPSVRSFSSDEGEADNTEALLLHPTMKPVSLVQDALIDCSQRNDVVLDAFLGSGRTLLAAEQSGRICVGIEINPRYVDVSIRRWQAITRFNRCSYRDRNVFRPTYREQFA